MWIFPVAVTGWNWSFAPAPMIIHKLILQHLRHRDDQDFYALQTRDALHWMERHGARFGPGTAVLDLGCGHGLMGAELVKRGCGVTFADETNSLLPDVASAPFHKINLDRDDVATLGSYDMVICSNVLEHLAKPFEFIAKMPALLRPGGRFYLSWTNWLSPWGGHDFSPFHYLGPHLGPRAYDWLVRRKRIHTPFVTLFPIHIGPVLRAIRRQPSLRLIKAAPRYYPELSAIMAVPGLREFLAWNCAVLLEKRPSD